MKYGMRLRGYSPGCQPAGVKRRYDSPTPRYYDIIEYDRKLTEEEMNQYSLDEIEE